MPTATKEIIQAAIEGLEVKKQRIDEVIAELRERMNGSASASPSPVGTGRRTMRIAEAQRKTWAAKRASEGQTAPSAAKRGPNAIFSPEGCRRIIEATKKRWAAYKAAQRIGK